MAEQAPTQPRNAEIGEPSLTASIQGLGQSPEMPSDAPVEPTQNHPPQQTPAVAPPGSSPSPSSDHLLPQSEPIHTPVNTAPRTNQPDGGPVYIPVTEGRHKQPVSPAGQPIHIPRYLKSNRKVDWNCLPPSSINSRFVGDTGVNTPNLPARPIGGTNPLGSPKSGTPPAKMLGVHSPRSLAALQSPGSVNEPSVNAPNLPARPVRGPIPLASHPPTKPVGANSPSPQPVDHPQPTGVNSPQAGVHSHWAPPEQQPDDPQPPLLAETGDTVTKAPPSGNETSGVGGGVNGQSRVDGPYPSNGPQRRGAPELGVGSPQFGEAQGLEQSPQGLQQTQEGLQQGLQQTPEGLQKGVYAVAGESPNLAYPPSMGTTAAGQVVQINFAPQAHAANQQYAPPAPMRRPPNMIGDVPKAKDAVKRRERERVRRAIMANIISGLRNYGGYNLPSSAADIEYIRALLREAGYVTEVDGTTYRPGVAPPVGGEHPPEAATSSREDYGTAQDTPPSTAAYAGSHGFPSVEQGQAPGNNGSQEQEAGGSEPPCELQVTGHVARAEVPPGATNRVADSADDMMLDESAFGPGKRLLGFVEGGSEPKKLKPS